jgi:hypothetical protein
MIAKPTQPRVAVLLKPALNRHVLLELVEIGPEKYGIGTARNLAV